MQNWSKCILTVLIRVKKTFHGAHKHLRRKARVEALIPLNTETFKKIEPPGDTSGSFRDRYNTSAIYKAFPGEDRSGNDLFATLAYSLEACLRACNKYNEFLTPGREPCTAGTMNLNQQQSANGQKGANCFLKTKVGNDTDTTNADALGFRLCQTNKCTFKDTILKTGPGSGQPTWSAIFDNRIGRSVMRQSCWILCEGKCSKRHLVTLYFDEFLKIVTRNLTRPHDKSQTMLQIWLYRES